MAVKVYSNEGSKEAQILAVVQSCAVIGLDGVPVAVEVNVSYGRAGYMMVVGLPDAPDSRLGFWLQISQGRLHYPH